jgi:hypothetical protein
MIKKIEIVSGIEQSIEEKFEVLRKKINEIIDEIDKFENGEGK